MGRQARLPYLPPEAEVLNEDPAVVKDGDQVTFFNAAGPIHTCSLKDRDATGPPWGALLQDPVDPTGTDGR